MTHKVDPKVWITSTPSGKDSLFETLMRDSGSSRDEVWKREYMNDFTGMGDSFARFGDATDAAAYAMGQLGKSLTSGAVTASTQVAKTITAGDIKDLAKRLESQWPTAERKGVGRLDMDFITPHPGYQTKVLKGRKGGEFKIDLDGVRAPGFRFDATEGSLHIETPAVMPAAEPRGRDLIAAALRDKNAAYREEVLLRAAREAPAKPEPQVDRGSEWGSW